VTEQPLETRVVETATPHELPERSATARAADHAAIAGSIDELLPALIAKLGATGLAELEIREDGLRIRLRRPPEGAASHDRRAGDRVGRTGSRGSAAGSSHAPGPSHGPGTSHAPGLTPVGPGREVRDGRESRPAAGDGRDDARSSQARAVATSPAVGIYHPRSEAGAGTRVRAGDRLGSVDMLGVPQEVVAPTDGLVGASLVDAGDAVEYGQELVVIEFPTAATDPVPVARDR
jgi:biotin carboxyl carrier protein